jgi:peptidoglycan hydrolase-like protein with peptidoglycan-binding domain
MALTRVWTPSKNYSGGGTKRLLVVHTTEGFTGPNGAYDCAVYFQGNVGASSQVCIDNYHAGKIWECVSRNNSAWTQCNYNSVAVSAEQCGYASWTRDYWLNNQSTLLHNTAQWLAEESKKFGIPLTILTASQAQGGNKGVCHHRDLGSTGCGHSDCGNGYPLDKVIEWAGGAATQPPSSGGGSGGTSAPPFPYPSSHYIGTARSDSACHSGCYGGSDATNTRKWQQRMSDRGWSIGVDGCYGPQSETVCRQFQADKSLSVDGLVGPNTWSKSWTEPIT